MIRPFKSTVMLTPLTDTDLQTLDSMRIERFRQRFHSLLENVALYISGLDRTLIVSGGEETKALAQHSDELKSEAWLAAAATTIHIYACNKLIYKGCITYRDTWNKLGLKAKGERHIMATAIQENLANNTNVENGTTLETESLEPIRTKIVKSLAITDIAADLETEIDVIQEFLEEHNAKLIDFGGIIIVSESEAVVAYEHYSLIRARQKMQERFALANITSPKPQTAQEKNTAKAASKPKKPTLTFKGKFQVNRSNYKRTVQNFLDAMFPDLPEEQDVALNQILELTEMGRAYLDKIVRAGDYKDKQHARDLLYKAAAELQSASDNAAPKKEEIVETAV